MACEGTARANHRRKVISMEHFPVHTIDTAPEASKSALGDVQARFGLIPNLAAAMATSPVLIQSFLGIFDRVHGGNRGADSDCPPYRRCNQQVHLGRRATHRTRAAGGSRSA
jgi:hypothetical protein